MAFRKLLPVASSWKNIGTLLGINGHILDDIERNRRNVQSCLQEMLSKRIKHTTLKPTWDELDSAVEPFNESVAAEIRDLNTHN